MPDSSTRMVFSNEMGLSFLILEFTANGNFKVYSIIKKMNKRSVIKTLQHDFELVLMNKLDNAAASVHSKRQAALFYLFRKTKDIIII